jgi:hypothetical protein
MSTSDQILKKQKYFEKTLSQSAIYAIYLRHLDTAPLFAENIWLQIPIFDLSALGLGLLYNILPIEFLPFPIDFQYQSPTAEETLQGIWANFVPVEFARMYIWMTDYREYILENMKEEYQFDMIMESPKKAVYGETLYTKGIYDPPVQREFLRSTFMRLRLLRKPDISYRDMLQDLAEYLRMAEVTDEHVWNRLMLIYAAQTQAFVLGLSPLGIGRLSRRDGDMAVVTIMDARGNIVDVKFRTLDHNQIGFILGLTPLGYGYLLPRDESIYKMPDGKKNPQIIDIVKKKIRGMRDRYVLTTFAYTNYHPAQEMSDYHKSLKTAQYDSLQTYRSMIEDWVERQIPPDEANPARIRHYQNAVLQLISWRAKRHRWGWEGWKAMTEDEFRDWWLGYWKQQGLNESVLRNLYEGIEPWLRKLREGKLELGERVKRLRRTLARLM